MYEKGRNKTLIDNIRLEFRHALAKYDKVECMEIVKHSLDENIISLEEIYLEILAPSLSSIAGNNVEQKIDIWQEHLFSSIVRTMIEICFPYVVKRKETEKTEPKGKVILSCLDDEQHDIGVRMISDLLLLRGYDVYLIGANTDKVQMLKAYEEINPVFCAVSVTNYYHLTKLQKTIDYLKENTNGKCIIVAGGYAITNTPEIEKKVFPDMFIKDINDLDNLKEVIS